MEETGGNNNNDDDKSTTGLNIRLQISLFNAAQDDLNDSFEKVIEDKDLSVSRLNHLNSFSFMYLFQVAVLPVGHSLQGSLSIWAGSTPSHS